MGVVGDLALGRFIGTAAQEGLDQGLGGVLGGLTAQRNLEAVEHDGYGL